LESTLAPFSKEPIFGWQNNTTNFLLLQDVLDVQQYPYMYFPIVIHAIETSHAYIDIVDIPIPQESITIDAYLFPKNIEITQENKEDWFVGSAYWFGLNRATTHCNRCERVRTNLKIDILDFVNQHHINQTNIDNYEIFLEGKGKLKKNIHGEYILYDKNKILQDGFVTVSLS
jgi:hypothetical protein